MMLLSFATLVVLALRVIGRRIDVTIADLFADANKSEKRSFDHASPAQENEELGLTPISSSSHFGSSTRHNGRNGMGEISPWVFTGKLKEFISAFKRECSDNSDSRFHMDGSPHTDLKVIEAVQITYWEKFKMDSKYIKTKGIQGCNGDAYNAFVCHVVFKLTIAVVTYEPLAGLAATSKAEAFYMVCMADRQSYGEWSNQWSQTHTCHLVPESVLTQNKLDDSFSQVSDDHTTMIDWNCGVPEVANEVHEATPVTIEPVTPVAIEPSVQAKVVKLEKIDNSSSEKCCCAEVGGEMRAFGVQLTGTQGGSDVALAVGHSGWWSGTPGSAKCPVISGLQIGGKPCACTVHQLRWKAPNTCKLDPAVESHSPDSWDENSKQLECRALCSERPRSSITQECTDERPVEMEMVNMSNT